MDAIQISRGFRRMTGAMGAVSRWSRAGLISSMLMLLSASLAPAAFVGTTTLVVVPATAFAQSGEPPCDPGDIGNNDGDGDETCNAQSSGKQMGNPKGGCDCTNPQGYSGDPIGNSTGNIYVEEDDFKGGGAWPLHLVRSYNSSTAVMLAMSASTSGIVGYTYPFGTGWNFSYGARLLLDRVSPLVSLEALRADGQVLTFTLTSGKWTPDADINDQLTEQTDSSGNPIGWTLTDADLNVERYDAAGHLLSITNRAGMVQTYTYSTSATPPAIAPAPGLLLSVAGPDGRTLQFTYNAQSRINTVTDPTGGQYTYTYDSYGDLHSVTYPGGSVRTYTYTSGYGSNQALASVVDETGTTYASYTYNTYGAGTSISMAGGVNTYQLDLNSSSGTATAQTTDPLGAVRNYSAQFLVNDFRNNQVQTPCPGCANPVNTTTYTYNANGYVTSETHVLGDGSTPRNRNYTWDTTDNLLLTFVDGAGSPQQRTTNTTWNTALRVPLTRTVQDNSGKTVTQEAWAYNAGGQVTAHCEIDPSSGGAGYACGSASNAPSGVRQWTYTYCTAVGGGCPFMGLMLTATGPRTDVVQTTSKAYYTSASSAGCGTPGAACYQPGDLKSITDALGHVTTFSSYDAAGRVTEIIDANGVITDFQYNPRGWLTSRIVRGGSSGNDATTSIGYTPYGAVASITQPDGVVTQYTYDGAHRLTNIIDALGNHIDFTLDAAGHRTAANVYAVGSGTPSRSHSWKFDVLGRLVKDLDAYGATTTYAYDGNDNRISATDPLGVTTRSGYDALDRLAQTIRNYQGSDPATQNTTTTYVHDARDNLTETTDPDSLNVQRNYDGLDNLDQLQSPDTGTTSYTYDAAGNRVTKTDARGVTATYTYDALNRLTSISYPTASLDVHYYYDEPSTLGCNTSYPIGRMTRMTDSTGTTRYCYDNRGNVIEKIVTVGGLTGKVIYTYDTADRLMGLAYPLVSTLSVSYTRDADGRIASVSEGGTQVVSSITYLPFGPATQYTFAMGGQVLTKTYDANYRATDITGGNALNLHFTLDAMGNIVKEGDAPDVPTPNEIYQYDPLYRLSQVDDASDNAWQIYTYDKSGDRLTKATAGQFPSDTYSYTPNSHHLISISGYDASNRAFDADGNTTALQANGWTYGLAYDDANRLGLVQQNGATIATYHHNGLGQRVQKTLTGVIPIEYLYDESGKLLLQYASGQAAQAFIWADGALVATFDRASGLHYVYTDHLGTPRAVTTTTSTAPIWTWPWVQNPFGERAASGSNYTLDVRFPGQYFDSETGLSYNYFRDYEPETGRYIQSDPLGPLSITNSYNYVKSQPFTYTDFWGLMRVLISEQKIGVEQIWWLHAMSEDSVNDPTSHGDFGQLIDIKETANASDGCVFDGITSKVYNDKSHFHLLYMEWLQVTTDYYHYKDKSRCKKCTLSDYKREIKSSASPQFDFDPSDMPGPQVSGEGG